MKPNKKNDRLFADRKKYKLKLATFQMCVYFALKSMTLVIYFLNYFFKVVPVNFAIYMMNYTLISTVLFLFYLFIYLFRFYLSAKCTAARL